MKKIKSSLLIALALVSVTAIGAYAQAEFAVGIKGGPNFCSIDTKSTAGENYKNRTGFHAGAFALIKMTKIGIQPEILFSQQGSTLKYSGSPDLQTNFSYINVPIIIKLYTVAGINIQAGPQFGFLMSAKQDWPDTSGKITEQDIKDELKGSDFSVAMGLGWDLPFGLTLDGRYNLGLSNINDGGGSDIKNQVWQVSVGYKLFQFGK
jgi:hypothetical protein